MKKILIILIVVFALLIAAAGYLFFDTHYVVADGVHSRDVTQLDLSGQKLSEPEKLARLTKLTHLNLRDTGITEDQYRLLAQKLPDCEILWSVPFQGTYYPNDIESLRITQLAESDIALLAHFPNLTQIDADDCSDLSALVALQKAYPHLSVSYWVSLGGKIFPSNATALAIGNGTTEDLSEVLAILPDVSRVDASGCRDYAAIQALQEQYPQCAFDYTVYLGAQALPHTTTGLTIQDPDLDELKAVLPYLPALQTLQLTGSLPDNQDIHQLQEAFPAVEFIWTLTLFGKEITTAASTIDLSNIPMEDTREVESMLPYFNNLEKVIMCDCGISNEEMDLLGQRHPETRFVWTVSIGPHIRLRTDATYLMPYQFGTKLTDSQTKNLKYCVDLICIDLGHNAISDVSFLKYMPHMKYLLLAQTQVSDISACAGMEELEYAELFMTEIQDYSPLLSCPNLRDLNICYALPRDISALCQLTQLDNLYAKGRWNAEKESQLKQALSDVKLVLDSSADDSSTGSGWRELPRYFAMRDLLGMPYSTG